MEKNGLHDQIQSHPYPTHLKKFVYAYILPVGMKTSPHKSASDTSALMDKGFQIQPVP